MNKRILLSNIIVVIISANCFAQQKSADKPFQFHSINNVGLLEGQAGSALQLQTINGVQHRSWFAGIGVGLDYYRYRTIPLFVDVRKEFGKSKNKFFIYADAGMNFYWMRDKDVKQFYISDKLRNGFYSEAGTGYKCILNASLSLLFSCGYSYKALAETGGSYYLYPVDPLPGVPSAPSYTPEKINYHLNRLILKIAIEF